MKRLIQSSAVVIVAALALSPSQAQDAPPSRRDTADEAWRVVDQQIQLVWSEFCALLRAGDVNSALQYFEDGSRERYRETLRSMGDGVRQLPQSWSEIHMIEEFRPYARYALIRTNENGERRLHEVLFYRDQEGRWWLSSL